VPKTILLDGAHNAQAAENLGGIVRYQYRRKKFGPVTWVLACTKGKDVKGLLQPLMEGHDSIAVAEFGPVDGMPWIEPAPCAEIANIAKGLWPDMEVQTFERDIEGALKWAVGTAGKDLVVVAGSLYLVSDVLRLLRDKTRSTIDEVEHPEG